MTEILEVVTNSGHTYSIDSKEIESIEETKSMYGAWEYIVHHYDGSYRRIPFQSKESVLCK